MAKSKSLAFKVFKLAIGLPSSEDYGLTSQSRKSSIGLAAYIAVGFGGSTKKDKSNFYIIACGSSFETQNHLIYCKKVSYFETQVAHQLFDEYNELIHELNKLIKMLG